MKTVLKAIVGMTLISGSAFAADMKPEMKADMKEMKGDVKEMKNDVKADMKEMKADMKADMKEMKADMKGMKMEAPKPAPEMVAMTKSMVGTWKCTNKMMMPPDQGGTMEGKSTVTFKSELNGFALMGEMKMDKVKMMPASKGMIHIGYDPMKKMFMQGWSDDMGGMDMASSKGMEGDKLVWDGEGQMMGKGMKTRMTMTMKGPKELSTVHEGDMGDGKWVTMMEESCKK